MFPSLLCCASLRLTLLQAYCYSVTPLLYCTLSWCHHASQITFHPSSFLYYGDILFHLCMCHSACRTGPCTSLGGRPSHAAPPASPPRYGWMGRGRLIFNVTAGQVGWLAVILILEAPCVQTRRRRSRPSSDGEGLLTRFHFAWVSRVFLVFTSCTGGMTYPAATAPLHYCHTGWET